MSGEASPPGFERSDQLDQLAAALAQAQAKIEGARKDAKNPHLKNRYADLGSVWDACRVPLAEQGLAVSQLPMAQGEHTVLHTVLLHGSGQWIASRTPVDYGAEKGLSRMQALGSALTYARRYALAAIVGVCPEDDDGNAAGQPHDRSTASHGSRRTEDPSPRRPGPSTTRPTSAQASPEPASEGTTWDHWVAKLLGRWERAAPAADAKEVTSRSNRITQDLITQALAIDPPLIDEAKILRPSTQKGKGMVRDTAEVWGAARWLWDTQRPWAKGATLRHLQEKLAEVADPAPATTEPANATTWTAWARRHAATIRDHVPERIEVWDDDLTREVERAVIDAYGEADGRELAGIRTPPHLDDSDFVPRGEDLAPWLDRIDQGNPPLAPARRPEPATAP